MKTTMTTPLLPTMTGTLARMLDRMADVIGAQTMGIIAGLMRESIVESITTGTQRLGMIMVRRLTMEHLGIIVRLTMEHLGIIMVRLTRVRTHSDPECDDGSEDDGGQEVDGELVIACGNTTKVLEATERSFDPPAIAVASLIVPDRTSARTSAWNDRYCSR
jgi:hypothetical protein